MRERFAETKAERNIGPPGRAKAMSTCGLQNCRYKNGRWDTASHDRALVAEFHSNSVVVRNDDHRTVFPGPTIVQEEESFTAQDE